MKKVALLVLVFFTILLLASSITSASRRMGRPRSHHGRREQLTRPLIEEDRAEMKRVAKGLSKSGLRPDTVQVAGSRLPDCSHACGSCRPCKLVMVSFVCASLEEAETCPMAYKCMCRRKSYPVP